MSSFLKKVEQKLGDHPNASSDPEVNPTSGIGIGANQGDDPNKSWTENKVQAGMGSGDNAPHVKTGSTTSPAAKESREAAGLGNNQ
ncbi:hypothetical protein LTR08_000076 [Meristemomyces frigidus]|nr:hypothetical protein LTR08_000076 [Meristemomyces frigidus]